MTSSAQTSRASRVLVAVSCVAVLAACGTDEQRPFDQASDGQPAGQIACADGSLTAAGSSAQKNAMDEWVRAYQSACKASTINYQPSGSGAGIEQFVAGTVAFAGTDSSLKDQEVVGATARCKGAPALNLPMVIGPVALAYNLPGVPELVLDAPTIAKVFSGVVTTWDDPAIAALNPQAKLPSSRIQPFVRSDESGTTDNLQKYLKAAAPAQWTFGTGKKFAGPGNQSAPKSDGVTQAVKTTPNAISYVEVSFAENAGLDVARIATGASAPVELTTESAAEAVESATVKGSGNDLALELDYATKDEGAYPIVLVTYEIACQSGNDPASLPLVKSFLAYTASEAGQDQLEGAGYAPLPSSLRKKVEASVQSLS
ncbi:MAG: phosphate-binding protein precursor [Frankiales bacterium]|jgi:phosphate transport system substrate-binding protein|nr:phosphate-binding protein precursor [Frankiales bacterium]